MILGTRTDPSSNGLSTAKPDQATLMPFHQFIKDTSTAGNQSKSSTTTTTREDTKLESSQQAKRSSLPVSHFSSSMRIQTSSRRESTNANKDKKLSKLSSDLPTSLTQSQPTLSLLFQRKEDSISSASLSERVTSSTQIRSTPPSRTS